MIFQECDFQETVPVNAENNNGQETYRLAEKMTPPRIVFSYSFFEIFFFRSQKEVVGAAKGHVLLDGLK